MWQHSSRHWSYEEEMVTVSALKKLWIQYRPLHAALLHCVRGVSGPSLGAVDRAAFFSDAGCWPTRSFISQEFMTPTYY